MLLRNPDAPFWNCSVKTYRELFHQIHRKMLAMGPYLEKLSA